MLIPMIFAGLLCACGGGGTQGVSTLPPAIAGIAQNTEQQKAPPASGTTAVTTTTTSSNIDAPASQPTMMLTVGQNTPTSTTTPASAPPPATFTNASINPIPTPAQIAVVNAPKALAGNSSWWTNGQQVPMSFLNNAFNGNGPFYQQLPASPQLDTGNTSALAYYFRGDPAFTAGWINGDNAQQQYDYSFPIYTASSSDPLVTITCSHVTTASCVDQGTHIRLPALATQAGGSDHHLSVIQPNGVEYDFWLVTSNPPYANGSALVAAGEAHFSPGGGSIAPGFSAGAATAGGLALSLGQIYTSEFATGVINHAIGLTFACGTSGWVYPSSQTTGICANNQGIPLGSRVWWQPDDAQTRAMQLPRDIKTILVALHNYGGFFIDGGGGGSVNGSGTGMGTRLESQEPYRLYGNGFDPARNYATSTPGWLHIATLNGINRYVLRANGASLDFLDNLKVVAPCVTRGTC
jgi:hypothetical protein